MQPRDLDHMQRNVAPYMAVSESVVSQAARALMDAIFAFRREVEKAQLWRFGDEISDVNPTFTRNPIFLESDERACLDETGDDQGG